MATLAKFNTVSCTFFPSFDRRSLLSSFLFLQQLLQGLQCFVGVIERFRIRQGSQITASNDFGWFKQPSLHLINLLFATGSTSFHYFYEFPKNLLVCFLILPIFRRFIAAMATRIGTYFLVAFQSPTAREVSFNGWIYLVSMSFLGCISCFSIFVDFTTASLDFSFFPTSLIVRWATVVSPNVLEVLQLSVNVFQQGY